MEDGQFGNHKVGIIIQARYDSTRLPGKVLMNLPHDTDVSILERIINRANRNSMIHAVIVATSNDSNDNIIENKLKKTNTYVYRGSKTNVLSRYYHASKLYNLDTIVRLTGDNPIVLNEEMKISLTAHLNGQFDYTRNVGLPLGCGFEIMDFKAIEKSYNSNLSKEEKEHVTLHIKNNRNEFNINEVKHKFASKFIKKVRLTIDYSSDYALLNIVSQNLSKFDLLENYTLSDVLNVFEKMPWLLKLNDNEQQKKQFKTTREELLESISILDKLDMSRAVSVISEILDREN